MNIVTELSAVATAVNPTGTFRNLYKTEQNYKVDGDTLPIIYALEPLTHSWRQEQYARFKVWSIAITFLNETNLEDYSDEAAKETVVNSMETLANRFVSALKQSKDTSGRKKFRNFEEADITRVHDFFDLPMSGVLMNLTFEELAPYTECTTDELDACSNLLAGLSFNDKLSCILPTYDFSDDETFEALTDQQETDLTNQLFTPTSGYLYQEPLDIWDNTASEVTGDYGYWRDEGAYVPSIPANPAVIVSLDYTQSTSLLKAKTLSQNNIYGNTNRFTDLTGGQSYGNLIFRDHYTRRIYYINVVSNRNKENAISYANAAAYGGITKWRLPLSTEIMSLCIQQNGVRSDLSQLPVPITNFAVNVWCIDNASGFEGLFNGGNSFGIYFSCESGRLLYSAVSGTFSPAVLVCNFDDV